MAKKKIDLKNFSIDMIEDIEACVGARKVLFKRFEGESGMDISKRKADFINLIDEGRAYWVVFFCLKVMSNAQRYDFLRFCLDDIQQNFKGQVIDQSCCEMLNYINGFKNKQKVQNIGKKFGSQIVDELKGSFMEKCHSKLCYSLHHYSKSCMACDIKSILKACEGFIESLVFLVASEDEFSDIFSYRKLKEKEYALYSMKLTGVWPFE